MCCGNSILQKGLPFFYLHKIFYTLTAHLSINIIILFFYVLMFIFNDTTSRIYLAQHINRSKNCCVFF
ncbi:hypothetical protein EGW23_12425 [Enterococcus faecium]|nr:hypothetical protein EGW23_12425 [Enterococcus faecium]ROW85600.1 hypothetical protein EGW12_12340 [Enterococcus faecium]ROX36177.1 hypothetical protein EGW40_12330 [Enterococcus faecium]ROX83565.1 hypothetical protein EGW45_12335 [Enterococcus faecium]